MRKENSRFPRFLQEDTQWCWSLIKPYGLGLLTYPRRLTWSTRVARGLISGLTRLKRKNLTCYHVQMLLRQTRPGSPVAGESRVVPDLSPYRKNGMTNSLKQTQAANATKNPNTQKSIIVEALYGLSGNGCRRGFDASS